MNYLYFLKGKEHLQLTELKVGRGKMKENLLILIYG